MAARLLRGETGSLPATVAEVFVGLVLRLLLARWLGSEGRGVYAFVLSLPFLIPVPVRMGLPEFIARDSTRGQKGLYE